MSGPILIKGALLIDPTTNTEKVQDIRIDGGVIDAIGDALSPEASDDVLEGKGLWVCPGFIDIHTHLRDLGQKDKEDVETGTKAAAAGGYTTVVAMANTVPTIDNAATLSILLKRIEEKAHIEVLPVAAVTMNLAGAELTNMCELADLGAVAFSDDGMTITNMATLRRALEYARLTERLIISHAEDRDLSEGGCIQEGIIATRLGLAGIPAASETAAIAREIEIVRETRSPYHFTHLSCARSVELIRRAKQDGLSITCDVTPHHLTLSVDDITGYDTNYKMKPPLRLAEDIAALVEGLKDGTIDAIATDHAPHTRLEKATTMEEAAVGILGLETAFALCYEKLVLSGEMSKIDLIRLLTTKPAAVLDLERPSLEVGVPANIAVIDPQYAWSYDAAKGASRSHNSPYSGRKFKGKVVLTVFRGKAVFSDTQALNARITASAKKA